MLAALLAQFLDPDRGPEPSGDFRVEPEAFVALLLAGFAIGIIGHIVQVKTLVATGILMIFLATVGLPVWLQLTR
jgi:hypothetical protein